MNRGLSQELRQIRLKRHLTLRQVEARTGISNAYLSQLETGRAANPSPHVLRKLAEVYETPYESIMRCAGYLPEPAVRLRDIFLSHRATAKPFVRELAADIEAESFGDRQLLTWLDEAEIKPGQSVPGMINDGLEHSRFFGAVMTRDYFASQSGWPEAEWHAALNIDPDNRRARILPLLVEDCPYVPYLLRHLRLIDLRGSRYQQGLKELLAVLKEEPLPRPVTHRGQLISGGSRIDRSTLIAERAVPEADPDVITERLYCNLLPVERLPRYVYAAGVAQVLRKARKDGREAIPSKDRLKEIIRSAQEQARVGPEHRYMPAFRVLEDRIITFHDLEDPEGPLAPIIDGSDIEVFETTSFVQDQDLRRVLVSLVNMALARHAARMGLVIDDTRPGRFFFPAKNGSANTVSWVPCKKKAIRTVAKPVPSHGRVLFWRHLGAFLQVIFLVNRFYLKICPTWVITHDGLHSSGGPDIGRRVVRWTGPERNMQVLYHVRFWTSVLRGGRGGPISVWAGDQLVEVATVPAIIQQAYGIAADQKDLLRLLDEEAPLIADEEEQLVDSVLAEGIEAEGDHGEQSDATEGGEEDIENENIEPLS